MNNEEFRKLSGNVESTSKVDAFLYLLIRDHLPAGVVEKIAMSVEESQDAVFKFTNGYLAEYARNVSERLKK